MCLESITKTPKNHKVGYKLFEKDGDEFKTPVIEMPPYSIGKTYDAKSKNGRLKMVNGPRGIFYKAGFHYYLKMKHAKRLCGVHQAVVRIKVKNILATGRQSSYEAGVSEFMTLDKVVCDGHAIKTKVRKADFKKFLNICKEKVNQTIMQFSKQFLKAPLRISENSMKGFIDAITETSNNFVEYVAFIDTFPRQSKCFKVLTKVHIWALNNHNQYKKYYDLIVKDGVMKKRLDRTNYFIYRQFTTDIDNFVLTGS